MDSSWQVLLDILILLTAALVLGTIAEQLRQNAILGYLLAGTLVGPNLLGLVERRESVEMIAELGVALLLFTIGLEFSFTRLRRLGRIALLGGTLQVLITMAAGMAVAGLFVDSFGAAVAVGAIVSLSSTACVLRVLIDHSAVESIYGRNAVGILLLQDIAMIPLMLVLVVMSGGGSAGEAAVTLLRSLGLGGVLLGSFFLLFKYVVPRLLHMARWASNRELPVLLAIVLALGSAFTAHKFSLSPAMGAFLAGILLGESPFAIQIRADVGSLRTLLVTLFFASIGMIAEPTWALQHWHLVAAAVVVVVFGKTLVVWAVARIIGLGHGLAVATGLCLAQIGEFSFVLADAARGRHAGPDATGLIDENTFRLVVATTIATLFLTPFLTAAAPRVADRIERFLARRRTRAGEPDQGPAASPDEGEPQPPPKDLFILGFGPAGHSVAEALMRQHAERIVVMDLNVRNAAVANRYGLAIRVGDATQRDVLEHAGIGAARVIVITVPDPMSSRTIIEHCKSLAPRAALIVRARYHRRRWELQLAGALEIVDEEVHVGLRLAAEARKHLDRP